MNLADIPSPISAFLASPDVSEIMVNGPDRIFVEESGKLIQIEKKFADEADLLRVVRQFMTLAGKTFSPQTPLIDTRLTDGSRITITGPPVTTKISFSIRRVTHRFKNLNELTQRGAMSAPMAQFLKLAVKSRQNILIAGGTSCGKTTLLNAMATEIPLNERIVSIEDTFEIHLTHQNWVALETIIGNREEQNIDMRTLVAHAMHLRPDRILLGECRSGEALDILQGMNSGHEGGMATIHASSPTDALSRLETLVLMAGYEIPLAAVRQQISRALDLVVQMRRTAEGVRQITAITEVGSLVNGQIVLKDLFVLSGDPVGNALAYIPTGEKATLDSPDLNSLIAGLQKRAG
jgi:pilus assembly protein CpaF